MSALVRSGGLRGAEWWLRAAATSGRAYVAPGLPRTRGRPFVRAVAAACRALSGPCRWRANDAVVRGNAARFRSPGRRRGRGSLRGGVPLAAGFPRRVSDRQKFWFKSTVQPANGADKVLVIVCYLRQES